MQKKKNKQKIVLNIILIIILILIIYFGYKIFNTYKDNKSIEKEIDKIKEEVVIEEDNPLDTEEDIQVEEKLTLDFDKLKSINEDTVGWIRVSNTDIDYPIVKGNDNSYYLNHSFYKDVNMNGWIFENSNNSSNFEDENTILFGHNTNGTTMFSELKGIYNGDYGSDINITIYLEDNTISYKVFSIYLEDPNNTKVISKYTNIYILDEIKNKSNIDFNVSINEDDKILTLSTCNNITEDRIIIHAKRVN